MTHRLHRWQALLQQKSAAMEGVIWRQQYGKVVCITGQVIQVMGLVQPIGATCQIERYNGCQYEWIESEVVGFKQGILFLMPLQEVDGILPRARVRPDDNSEPHSCKQLPIGEGLLGRVVDAQGVPLDDLPLLQPITRTTLRSATINPLQRAPIEQVLDVGVQGINGLLTVGKGQRLGLFAGSGVGKSVLLGMMARYTQADVIVVGLIGERGREVKEFIDHILGAEGLSRAVVVAVPANYSPLLRLQGAVYATRIAEYFRDKGKDVLLIMDSLTRYAMAQREIALSIGEPPATKGYPPSVFAKLSSLVERAGNGITNGGSITAFYTVLSEGDDQQDPIADSARSILDGHIVLSRSLAEEGHYPSIDIELSISRVMTSLISAPHYQQVLQFKKLLACYQRNKDLISVGAYTAGNDPLLDAAVQAYPRLAAYLQQDISERRSYELSCTQLAALFE